MRRIGVLLAAVLLANFFNPGNEARAADSVATGPKIPILAWGGVPYDKASDERYAELAGAGINIHYSGAANADMMEKLLDLAHKHGIKQMIAIPELQKDPEGVAKRFKDHPAIAGYYLRDEPGAGLFAELGSWAKRIQSVDSKNPCYVNLFPTYADNGQLETQGYQKYLDRFVAEVPVPMLSWDHYPIIQTGKGEDAVGVRGDYYNNLELCFATAKKAKRPIWAFALATAHSPYPIPQVAHLRLQVFSDLAYGAQTIQYFTYWTTKSDIWNFHQGPIEKDGSRTPTYDRMKQVNEEIQALRGVFLGSDVISVGHTGQSIPSGTKAYQAAGPAKNLETEGLGGVVSLLAKGQERFLVVVNRDIHKKMPLRIEFEAGAGVRAVTKDGSIKSIQGEKSNSEIEPGDVAIFTWTAK